MIEVTFKRPEPPVESVTLTLDPETALAVKTMAGLGTVHLSGDILPTDTGTVYYSVIQPLLHDLYDAMTEAGL